MPTGVLHLNLVRIKLKFGVYSLLDKEVICRLTLSSQLSGVPNPYGSEADDDIDSDSHIAGEFSCCDDEEPLQQVYP